MRKGYFTQASTVTKLMINQIPTFGILKDVSMNSSNSDYNQTMYPQDNEVDITDIVLFVTVFKTGVQIPNQIPGPPVELFTATVNNIL